VPVVNLPPGCAGLRMEDGTHYTGREGGHVTVADEHAPHIRREVGGDAGLTGHGSFRSFMGTKDGRWCSRCRFLAQSWSTLCPRCGEPTVPEGEMPAAPRSLMPSACLVPITPAG
jgi:hypothetical protein